jgi:hypothetical protein
MKKIIILLVFALSSISEAQTLIKLKQLEKAATSGSVIVSGVGGVPKWDVIPKPTLQEVLTTGNSTNIDVTSLDGNGILRFGGNNIKLIRDAGATISQISLGNATASFDAQCATNYGAYSIDNTRSTVYHDSEIDLVATSVKKNGSEVARLIDITGVNSGTNTGNETLTSIATINNSASAKTTLVDADLLAGMNSASSFSLMKVTCLNVANYLLGIFNTVYSTISNPTFSGTVTTPAIIVSAETANTIASFDASKNIKSLSTSTYPSFTELSYVKGVTSSIQPQINSKQATLVSGTNIRTVNGSTLLGSTDLQVGTILGSVASTVGIIPIGTGVANTTTTNPNFSYSSGILNVLGTNIVAKLGSSTSVMQMGDVGAGNPNSFLGSLAATSYLGQNLYYNGTTWVNPNTAAIGSMLYIQGGSLSFNTANSANQGVGFTKFAVSNLGIATFGVTSKMLITPDYTGSNELTGITSLVSGNGTTGSIGIIPSSDNKTVGSKVVLAYYSGTTEKSAIEYANGSTGIVTVLGSGGQVKVGGSSYFGGTTAPTSLVHIAASTTTMSALKHDNSSNLLTTAQAGSREFKSSFYDTKNSGLRYGLGGVIFNSFADAGNTTTTETDLYSYTTPANTFATDGESLDAEFGGLYLSSATATRQIKVYFAGYTIFDSGALLVSNSTGWTCSVKIMRSSSTTVRYMIVFTAESTPLKSYTSTGGVATLTLSGTNILKITGTSAGSGAATNDIVLKMSRGSWFAAANN